MSMYESNPGKTPGNDSGAAERPNDKPATITVETTSGETKKYDVEHHLRSDHGWVSMWLNRDDGIDVQVPRERVVEIKRGREHHHDGERELVADGGLEWISEGPQGIRPAKKFVHTRCGSYCGRVKMADGGHLYYCPECDERTTLKAETIRFEVIDR